jgi:hypothetical protein
LDDRRGTVKGGLLAGGGVDLGTVVVPAGNR